MVAGELTVARLPDATVLVRVVRRWQATLLMLRFLGELTYSMSRLVVGRARLRRRDLLAEVEAAGARSFSIVAVVSFLLGVILAFVGNVTLRPFGASVYVANVVAGAMAGELGPVI